MAALETPQATIGWMPAPSRSKAWMAKLTRWTT